MSSFVYSRETATSPWMLGTSALIHALLILALIVVSTAVVKRKPPERPFIVVTPVAPPGPPTPVILQPKAPEESQSVNLEQVERADARDKAEPQKIRTVTARPAASKLNKQIHLEKRKRKPARVAALPKEKPKKQPPKKHSPKKRESDQDYLNKRLADAQKRANSDRPRTPPGPGPAHPGPTDVQLARWYNGVRDKVNSHWSVFQENRSMNRETLVGVQLADDGTLLNARVDESSGDPVFDRSAMIAVRQAAPFPPVPPGIREKIRQEGGLALRFRPGGME